MVKDSIKILEWLSVTAIIAGAGFLAFENPFFSALCYFVGSLGWCVVAIMWKKKSLLITNIVIALVFVLGWIY